MNMYKRHRFPPDVISYAVWSYHRFNLSHRDIEDLLAERGITVSYELIRVSCIKFGPEFARRLKRKHLAFRLKPVCSDSAHSWAHIPRIALTRFRFRPGLQPATAMFSILFGYVSDNLHRS